MDEMLTALLAVPLRVFDDDYELGWCRGEHEVDGRG